MTKLNIHDAKTNLSKYLRRVQRGEVVTLCKNGEPIAQIIPFRKKTGKRPLGIAKGLGTVPPSFFEPLTDEELPGMGLS